MNEVLKAMKERRSIRHYTSEPISNEELNLIIEAGQYAPSSFNNQASQITALCNPDAIAKLEAVVKESTKKPNYDYFLDLVSQPNFSLSYNAPVFILASIDLNESDFPAEDGAMIMANVLLAAHTLGLGGCWAKQISPLNDEPDTRAVLTELGIPENHVVIGCACIGHRGGDNPAPRPPQKIVHIVR